jgi:DNA-binding winged helix-turn-helix (wHTH) protein/tetratricopeptide (TPR) repeat protein
MEQSAIGSRVIRFGPFELDPTQGRLTSHGILVRLQEQPFAVLKALLENPGTIVSREELRRSLWPEGTYVDFEGSLNAALKRLRATLHDDPVRPRYIETVPRRGYRFIGAVTFVVPVTAPSPHEPVAPTGAKETAPPREASADEQVERVEPTGTPVPRVERNRARRVAVMAAVLVILLAGSAGLLRLRRGTASGSPALAETTPIPARRSVAVLGFQNSSGNPQDAWLSIALSQMLSTELAAGETLRLVSEEDIAGLRASSPWSPSDSLGRSTTSRIGTALNSDWLVLGSYAVAGEAGSRKLRLDARLQDAGTGEILAEFAETGSEMDPFAIVSRLGEKMRDRLGVPAVPEAERPAILASVPAIGEAARFYALGLMKLREFDALAAKELFQQAIAIDPDFPLAHSMLAQAWGQLGYDNRSREEAKRALDLSAGLPRADRMLVEGAYYESLADPEKAAATYRALLTLFPDSVDYGLRLVAMLDRTERHEEALETIRQLHRLPPPAGDDARLDLWESKEISFKSQPEAKAPLERGLAKAAARGQRLIYADAKLAQCGGLEFGDHPVESFPSCQEAYDIFLAAGYRTRAATALRHMADVTATQGRTEEALRVYDRAIHMARETGSRSAVAAAENNMAILLENEGQLDRAERLFLDVKKDFEEVGDKLNINTALENIADIQMLRGDLRASEKTFEEVISRLGTLDRDGYPFYRLANLHLMQGDLDKARREAEQGIAMLSARGADFQYVCEARVALGEILEAGGDLDGARHQFQQALDTRTRIGGTGLIASSRASLASLSLEDGHASEAEAGVREALSEFEKEKNVVDLIHAYVDLSRALLMLGRIEEARTAILHAANLARSNPDPSVTYPVTIQDARVKHAAASAAGAGRNANPEARRQLQSVIADARRRGYFSFACEARLALGELEFEAEPALGRSDLDALVRDAHAHGFDLISRKAADLLARGGHTAS